MITRRARLLAVSAVAGLSALALAIVVYQRTETIPPQPRAVGLVEQRMKREMRRGWLRVLLDERVLEVRVNGEALLGYTGRPAEIDSVDPGVVRSVAKKALDLYVPPQFGAPASLDSVRVRLRHAYMFGPFTYRTRGKVFAFATTELRP